MCLRASVPVSRLNVVDLKLPSGHTVKGGAFPKPKASALGPRQPISASTAVAGKAGVRAPLNASLRGASGG